MPPRRNCEDESCGRLLGETEAERFENSNTFRRRDAETGNRFNSFGANADDLLILSCRIDIERVFCGNAARDFANERHASLLCLRYAFRIRATLKSMRGFRVQAEKFGRAPHRRGVKIGAFDQNISRGI